MILLSLERTLHRGFLSVRLEPVVCMCLPHMFCHRYWILKLYAQFDAHRSHMICASLTKEKKKETCALITADQHPNCMAFGGES